MRTLIRSVVLTFIIATAVCSASAQTLKWSYTLPAGTFFSHAEDGVGGSAWLLEEAGSAPDSPTFLRLVWLNKAGKAILTNDFGTNTVGATDESSQSIASSRIVRCTPTEVTVAVVEMDPTPRYALQRFTIVRGHVHAKRVDLEATPEQTLQVLPSKKVSGDKLGFFVLSRGETGPTTVRRYSN